MDKEVAELVRTAVIDVLEEVRKVPTPPNSHQTVTLHHADPPPSPPWHVWICVTCCLIVLVVSLGLAVMFINHDRKIDDLNSYLNAIYMMAPHLKPKESE
jgi:hypothetical protein